jgi:hypothetical protein
MICSITHFNDIGKIKGICCGVFLYMEKKKWFGSLNFS